MSAVLWPGDPDQPISASFGLFSYYRLPNAGTRSGTAGWDWESVAKLLPNGGDLVRVDVERLQLAAAMSAEELTVVHKAVKKPDPMDIPNPIDLTGRECTDSSYFTWGADDFVWHRAGIAALLISRHGSRPRRIPTFHPASQPLPGGINVGFFDGHAGLVRLEDLWSLYWHRDWEPPAKSVSLRAKPASILRVKTTHL